MMISEKVLYTSAEVRRTIIDIFNKAKGRRVAITAFVGSGAETYLPRSKGIELICWPQAGGTNPNAIRVLLKKGVKVSFADALHMKIYWTEDQGAVITSANLSTNALGAGNLKEIGLFIPSNLIDIDRIISTVEPRDVTKTELDKLDKAHRAYQKANKVTRGIRDGNIFLKWFDLPLRSEWRIGYWEEEISCSLASKRILRNQYNLSEPEDFIGCDTNTYKANDWILTFRLRRNIPTLVSWLFVDFVAKTERSDKAYYTDNPCQAVQVWPKNRYPEHPFLIDARFRNALTVAIREYGVPKFKDEDPYKPPKGLIELIRKNY